MVTMVPTKCLSAGMLSTFMFANLQWDNNQSLSYYSPPNKLCIFATLVYKKTNLIISARVYTILAYT